MALRDPQPEWVAPAVNIGLGVFFVWLFVRPLVVAIITFPTREDKRHIRDDLTAQGAQLLCIARIDVVGSWWRRDQQRHYRLNYRDKNGWEHHAVCQTSNWAGIYYADDQVSVQPPAADNAAPDSAARIAELQEENRRLREELNVHCGTALK